MGRWEGEKVCHGPPRRIGRADVGWLCDLGVMDYQAAWDLQRTVHERVLAGQWPATVLFVEHPPVITLGKRGRETDIVADAGALAARGVQVVHTDRGGQVTFHGPGQLVVYPIVPLEPLDLGASSYVHALEAVLIDVLGRLSLAAGTDPKGVGVWVSGRKIAAIGVRIRKGVTLHGVALNLWTDLSFFDLIVPCGIADRQVTSIEAETGQRPDRAGMIALFADCMARRLGYNWRPMPASERGGFCLSPERSVCSG